ncbi:CsgG/HfaB family protein [Dyadobacter sp. CY261]|uniref:CsgG/HfaB family protein n=1 Tax=Dyadobacter sp. CY261 TaxID=2907203 RepID=UPI001F46740E|nr:CsgG/HfaB family protein [Dyadobacter sp. CY261]MCF0070794.1 CsgG/HfaB family protein [Dyadobacter sp. CY261]
MKALCSFLTLCLSVLQTSLFAQDASLDARLQQLSVNLANGIRAKGKTRIGVADLTDLKGYSIELGRWLATEIQGNLINTNLTVINRERLSQLFTEQELTSKRILDPKFALELQKATTMEVIVIGNITPFAKEIAVNLQAVDLQGAVAIASSKISLPRTQDINDLLEKVIPKGDEVLPHDPKKNSAGETSMTKNECEQGGEGFGRYCFTNTFNEPILLYQTRSHGSTRDANVLISPGKTGCAPIFNLVYNEFDDATVSFKTIGGFVREGYLDLVVSKCKSKLMVLSKDNLYLKASK